MTKEEKIEGYKFALENATKEYGICQLLRRYLYNEQIIRLNVSVCDIPRYYFPELMKYKPKDKEAGGWWFNTKQERVQVLNKILEEIS